MFSFTNQTNISIFLVVMLGYVLRKFNSFDNRFIITFSGLFNKYLLPFLFFWIIANNQGSDGFDWKISFIIVILTLSSCLIGYIVANISNISERSKFLFIIGCYRFDLGLSLAFIYFLFSKNIVRNFCMNLIFLLPILEIINYLITKRIRPSNIKERYDFKEINCVILNPIIIGGVLGWISSKFGLYFPLSIDKTAEMIIATIFPLVLIITGGSIKIVSTSPYENAFVIGVVSRIICLPLIAYFFSTAMSVSKTHLNVVIIFFSIPSFIDRKIIKLLYRNEYDCYIFFMISVLISFLTISLWTQILGMAF